MNIGQKIAELRKSKGLTQKELATLLNVTDKAVSRWESNNGNPDIEIIPKIAEVFNVTTDYLLTDQKEQHYFEPIIEPKSGKAKYIVGTTLFSIAVAAFLTLTIVFLSIYLVNVLNYYAHINDPGAQGIEGIGRSFPKGDIVNATIAYAKAQGVVITKDSDTFVQWQGQLLGKYTLHGNTYVYNQAVVFNYRWITYLVISISSFVALIPCIFFQLKCIFKLKRLRK